MSLDGKHVVPGLLAGPSATIPLRNDFLRALASRQPKPGASSPGSTDTAPCGIQWTASPANFCHPQCIHGLESEPGLLDGYHRISWCQPGCFITWRRNTSSSQEYFHPYLQVFWLCLSRRKYRHLCLPCYPAGWTSVLTQASSVFAWGPGRPATALWRAALSTDRAWVRSENESKPPSAVWETNGEIRDIPSPSSTAMVAEPCAAA